MQQRTRLDRLEHLTPQYLEVWEQDESNPKLYHYEGETLAANALSERADATPGLTVIRINMRDCNPEAP